MGVPRLGRTKSASGLSQTAQDIAWCLSGALNAQPLSARASTPREADRLVSAGFGSKSHRGGYHLCHIDCAGSNPGRTTRPHVERQRGMVDGGRVVAAAWLRRASGDRSKKTANRTAVARLALRGP
ncbi:MAG: hypothetical protein K0Q89_2566 [Thermomicrobiales bacterium]|nr:hypothetical protein [Thermomicrobiales bacterium]